MKIMLPTPLLYTVLMTYDFVIIITVECLKKKNNILIILCKI